MKITFLWAMLFFASVAFADDSGNNPKYPVGSPEWRSVLQKKIALLKQEQSSLLTVKNGELYEDAERRYKRAEGLKNRINKLSIMLADNSENSTNRARKPEHKPHTESDITTDSDSFSKPAKYVATARPATDSATPPIDPSERKARLLEKSEQLAAEHAGLQSPEQGESNKQASVRQENAKRKLRKINKIESELDK